jgi:hypothetical protein
MMNKYTRAKIANNASASRATMAHQKKPLSVFVMVISRAIKSARFVEVEFLLAGIVVQHVKVFHGSLLIVE